MHGRPYSTTCLATNMTTCSTCTAVAVERSRSRHRHDGGNAGYCCSVPRCDGSCLPHSQRRQRNALGGVCPQYSSCMVFYIVCSTSTNHANAEIQAAVGNARNEYLLQEGISLANWKVDALVPFTVAQVVPISQAQGAGLCKELVFTN